MCTETVIFWKETGTYVMHQQMDAPSSAGNSIDETPRVKLLCSFLGNIMPRPQDGKLRYVGGETRIVSIPRDISYEELMSKMKELYESASVLKYQQPDEDLDALVSVVNDDDVVNMMEEYEKLGSVDGFTRLRIFLSPHQDSEGSLQYIDGDERGTEKRYVDALNYLSDGSELRRQHMDSSMVCPIDDIHLQDAFYDGLLHDHRSSDISVSPYNLRHVAVPQRYSDSDGPWSPAYYSPRHYGGHIDPRTVSEFPNSPPSGRYRMQFGEFSEKFGDRISEEITRSQVHHPVYEMPSSYGDNVAWTPSGAVPGDMSGFPGNLFHVSGGLEGSNNCEHCKVAMHKNQVHVEQSHTTNHPSQCSNRDPSMLNTDHKLSYAMYPKDQNDPHTFFNEALVQDRGWNLQHQPCPPNADESRGHVSGVARFNNQCIVDCSPVSYPVGRVNLADSNYLSSNFTHQRAGVEMRNEPFHDPAVPLSHHVQVPSPEDHSVWYGNYAFISGSENVKQRSPGNLHSQAQWKNAQNPVHAVTSYLASVHMDGSVDPTHLTSGSETGQRMGIATESYHLWVESSQKPSCFERVQAKEYNQGPDSMANQGHHEPETKPTVSQQPFHSSMPADVPTSSTTVDSASHMVAESTLNTMEVANLTNACVEKERISPCRAELTSITVNNAVSLSSCDDSINGQLDVVPTNSLTFTSDDVKYVAQTVTNQRETEFVPGPMATTKKVALEETVEVVALVSNPANSMYENFELIQAAAGSEDLNADDDLELDCGNDTGNKIESTKEEAEAIGLGLQTIRNEDLEEIRELGSGTYGAVYHGKWKGSDVAIKRIKASCFDGTPSKRERLIADFWKEALTLSSLHHPNVVSFYGIVRDGVEGSLATVTEYMINGSLKQFLQKKDRTIDRRKRLLIAMDAAFGMEYLHGKDIVHFDLKCENLLVNMRDPQRPICKIGDLGLSKVKQHTLVSGGVRGTLPWMAPELLSGQSDLVTEKVDVYSFAIVMWEILTGEEPYAGMHGAPMIGGIISNTLRPEIPTWCDPEWKALMQMCWSSDPAERPSFSDISRKLRSMAAAINLK